MRVLSLSGFFGVQPEKKSIFPNFGNFSHSSRMVSLVTPTHLYVHLHASEIMPSDKECNFVVSRFSLHCDGMGLICDDDSSLVCTGGAVVEGCGLKTGVPKKVRIGFFTWQETHYNQ